MKHTKGPWELSEGNTSVWARSPLNAKVKIASILKHSPMNGIDSEANAALIASAPALLAILEAFVDEDQEWSPDFLDAYADTVRSVISKAKSTGVLNE